MIAIAIAASMMTACTHDRVEVSKISDAQMSCAQIQDEVTNVKLVRQGVKDKTGFSGRNIAMGLFFWPGVIVNEVNGNKAEADTQKRLERLVSLHEQKGCDQSKLANALKDAAKSDETASKETETMKDSEA